jgi:hypothetical protein
LQCSAERIPTDECNANDHTGEIVDRDRLECINSESLKGTEAKEYSGIAGDT